MSLTRSEIAEMLGSFFAYHGWTIHMDDRAGQPFNPFEVLAMMVDNLRQPDRSEAWRSPEFGDGYDLRKAEEDAGLIQPKERS